MDRGSRARAVRAPRWTPAPQAYSAGYAKIPDYNGNPASFWGEKRLSAQAARAPTAAAGRAGAPSGGRRREMTFDTPSPPIETP